jgi:hypothetical protein
MAAEEVMAAAVEYARAGVPVLPFRADKKGSLLPGRKWKGQATTDEATVRSWAALWSRPGALIGTVLDGTRCVLDIDYPDRLDHEVPDGATRVGGRGSQVWLDGEAPYAAEITNRAGDTIGELLGAGHIAILPTPGSKYSWADDRRPWHDAPPVPDWARARQGSRNGPATDNGEPLTSRNELIALAGELRHLGLSRDAILAALLAMVDDGRIEASDPSWPWAKSDLTKIADEAGKWAAGEFIAPPRILMNGARASDLDAVLTPVSEIELRAVRWLWSERVPMGELVLLAGREGVGKSTFEAWLTARVTRGDLDGQSLGHPRNVLVVATEDDWGTTIRPRLMAARADLDRVFRLTVESRGTGRGVQLHLPDHLGILEKALDRSAPAMVVFSPLISRLTGKLDSHKDQEVRQALEPLVAMAQRHHAVFLGLIHMNKSVGTDPLKAVMGSIAFGAVARSVLFIQRDPDEPSLRLLGVPKNNLGKTDHELGLLAFRLMPILVGKTTEGDDVTATVVAWDGSRDGSSESVMNDAAASAETRTATIEAADWLRAYLVAAGGTAPKSDITEAARGEGYERNALDRARKRLGVVTERTKTMPSTTTWTLSEAIPQPVISTRLTHYPSVMSEMGETGEVSSHLTDLTHLTRTGRAKRETSGYARANDDA